MAAASEYTLEPIRDSGEFTLYRARQRGNSSPVLVVAPTAERPVPQSLRRLEHEYSLAAELEHTWAAKPLALTRHEGRTILVLADPGGEPLDRVLERDKEQPLDPARFLSLAVNLATALGHAHQQGLIHKDVKPENVLVDDAGHVWLSGFGIASQLPRERQAPAPPETIAGTLAYMSPEQTGRMNRSMDTRSDLYSLGVTLYQMLTGELPFAATDPLEWVHCHIARQPIAPADRREVPERLSAITMRLLAKNADERYQTAAGLEADLRRCLTEWQLHGRIDSFPLCADDLSDRLLIPEKLYGRKREVGTLLAAFDRVVAGGRPELVLVSGYPGVGKSAVVNELHKSLVPPRGLFASGKFEQYKRDIPYATVAQAFQSLIRPLLSKSEAELSLWRDDLSQALSPNGSLLVDLVPELKLIIGEQAPVAALQPREAKTRARLAFRRFISVFAHPEHPLALFLDDLQWLDAATLDFLEDLPVQQDLAHVLVVGAYRDNEVDATHPLTRKLSAIREAGAAVQEIQLAPLGSDDLARLIADTLHCESLAVSQLAQLVHLKTAGNPFFVLQFIHALVEERLIAFEHEKARWRWDLDAIRAKNYTHNVVDLMVANLSRLPVTAQKALQQLACIGNGAEIATLSAVLEASEQEVEAELWEALHQELIVRSDGSYWFAHDRVQEAAYSLLAKEVRAEAHLRIGRLLNARTPPEKREGAIFEIVNQFNRGAELITSEEERFQVAELNLAAGKRAKSSTAYGLALQFAIAGAALSTNECWERRHDLIFQLELHRAECEFLTGEPSTAAKRIEMLRSRAADAADTVTLAAATCLGIDVYMTLGQIDRAVAISLDYLHHLGIEWPVHPAEQQVRSEYERIWSQLGSHAVEEIVDFPLMSDPASIATLDVLTRVLPAALFTDRNLSALVICRSVSLSIERGNNDGSCLIYVWVSNIAGHRFGDYRNAFRFAQLGYDLVEKRGLKRFQAPTYHTFAAMILPWMKHPLACCALERQAFEIANKSGDLTYAVYTRMGLIGLLIAAGDPLIEVQSEAENGLGFAQTVKFGFGFDTINMLLGFIGTLRGSTTNFGSFDHAGFDEKDFERNLNNRPSMAQCWYWVRKLQAHFFAGDFASAIEASLKAGPLLLASPTVEIAEYEFYSALARAACCDSATPDQRREHFDALVAHYERLQIWSEHCPENFENRAALVGAEIARIEGRELDAQRAYEKAIKSARENSFVHNEGLAHELAAQYYLARGFETAGYAHLLNARNCYDRWGADGKLKQLDEHYPRLRVEQTSAPSTGIGPSAGQLDVEAVMKASQAISSEMVLPALIEKLMRIALEHAGAERGLLILIRDGEPQIEAEATTGPGGIEVIVRKGRVAPSDLPEAAFRYVIRTKEPVLLDNASADSLYSKDEYVRQKRSRSIVCLPIVKQAKLVGALYVENNLAPFVFTPDKVAVLQLLASQAAISLENAALFTELQRSETFLAQGQRLSHTGSFGRNTLSEKLYWSEETYRIYELDRSVEPTLGWLMERIHPEDRARVQETIEDATRQRTGFDIEYRLLMRDNSVKYLHVVVQAFENAAGELEFIGAATDITQLKKAERNLGQIIDTIPTLSWCNRTDGSNEFLSKSWHEYTGLSPEEAHGWGWQVTFHPDDLPPLMKKWGEMLASGESGEIEARLRRWDGIYRWFLIRAEPFRDESGAVLRWYGTSTDIDDRKQAEDKLKESEAKHRVVIDTANDVVISIDESGTIILANPATKRTFGYEPTELIGRPLTLLMPESLREFHEAGYRRYLKTGERHLNWQGIELTAMRANGDEFPVEVSFGEMAAEGQRIFTGFIRDITEKKRAEEALLASERNLRLTIDAMPVLAWSASPDGSVEFINQRWLNYTGLSPAQVQGWGWDQVMHPEDLERVTAYWERIISTGKSGEIEARLKRFDGIYRWFLLRASPLHNESGAIVKWYGTNTDMEDRKRGEEALRESEQSLRLILDGIAGLVAIMSATGDIETVNRQVLEYFGRTTEQLNGWSTGNEVHPDDLPAVYAAWKRSIETMCVYDIDHRLRRADGVYRWFHARGLPLCDPDGRVVRWYVLLTDIHDRKQAEEALRQAQGDLARINRVTTMGELAASLAHEVSQPISGAMTNASVCLRKLGSEQPNLEEVRGAVTRIARDAQRAADIIGRIRSQFEKGALNRGVLDLNEIIRETVAVLRSEAVRYNVSVRTELATNFSQIIGDRVQLQQVTMNLLLNSIEAMKDVDGMREVVIRSQRAENEQVLVSVSDTGVGLPPQLAEQIFDPFFTTKPHGTGMGLRISRSIIESHGGHLWAMANDGPGATFAFSIPCEHRVESGREPASALTP